VSYLYLPEPGRISDTAVTWHLNFHTAVWTCMISLSVGSISDIPGLAGHHQHIAERKLQNYWVFGLFPSSGILETRKHDISETGSPSVLSWGGKITYEYQAEHKASFEEKMKNYVGTFHMCRCQAANTQFVSMETRQ
jgi:hypothetical protein